MSGVLRHFVPANSKSYFHVCYVLQDFYQFVAQHVKPLFVLRVPHPQKELPLPEVATESAQIYSNHVLVVQKKEGRNLQELMLFHDAPPEVPSAPCASSELEEEKVIYINQSKFLLVEAVI